MPDILTSALSSPRQSTALQRGAIYFAAWTAVAFATAELQYFAQSSTDAEPFWRMLRLGLVSCWLWALFTPPILWVARHVPIRRSNWPRALSLHLIAAAAFTLVDVAIMREINPLLEPTTGPRAALHVMFLRQYFLYSLCYFVIVALGHARYYAKLSYERDLRAAQLEAQLSAARLTALQGQLRPHFLFNTLNMIAEQVYTDPAGADAMLTRLGLLLRSSFVETDRERVPLRRELELLESYVEIMQGRFRGRLSFELDVEPATLDALVPRFILQPLVENAIKYGVEPREEGGSVTVWARHRGESLALEVRDDGDGLIGAIREGTGVRNTRERLHHLYGAGHQQFALVAARGGGTIASIVIPFDTDDGPAPSFTTPSVPAQDATDDVRRTPPASAPAGAVVSPAGLRRSAS